MSPLSYRHTIGGCLLALSIWTPITFAESTTTTEEIVVDLRPVAALHRMSAALRELKTFEVTTQATREKVLTSGQKILVSGSTTLDYLAPNKLRATMDSISKTHTFYYDGQNATLFTPATNYYTTVPAPATVHETLTTLADKYGVVLPLADLFTWGTPDALNTEFESSTYVGRDYVNGVLCDQYAFRQGSTDWQIWIESTPQLLPRKLAITNTADAAMPQFIQTLDWNLAPKFSASEFTFKAPANAVKIPLRERAAQ